MIQTRMPNPLLTAPADRLVTLPKFPRDGSVRSVGWHSMAWAQANLQQPDGPYAGKMWRPIGSQRNFLLWYYALTDEQRWWRLYRELNGRR